eukprot:1157467-Pelagomonas_calceolata.AAC.9
MYSALLNKYLKKGKIKSEENAGQEATPSKRKAAQTAETTQPYHAYATCPGTHRRLSMPFRQRIPHKRHSLNMPATYPSTHRIQSMPFRQRIRHSLGMPATYPDARSTQTRLQRPSPQPHRSCPRSLPRPRTRSQSSGAQARSKQTATAYLRSPLPLLPLHPLLAVGPCRAPGHPLAAAAAVAAAAVGAAQCWLQGWEGSRQHRARTATPGR